MAGRTLGYGLLGGAGLLALLMIAWLAVSGASGGGIVLGLILLVVLAGPLALGGIVVLNRLPAEAAAEKAFASKRRVIDADRLFRRELAPELRQLARQPELPQRRLQDLAEDLERSTYDTAEWYDAVQLEDEDVEMLKRYEDLVWERVRVLRQPANTTELERRVRELEDAVDQRRDLLIRGRRAPAIAPSQLLGAGTPARGIDALRKLAVSDAVTLEDDDYVVEGVASYFADGQTWKLVHLVPSGTDTNPRWLYVGPAGQEIALLDETHAQAPSAEGQRTATVDVTSRAGAARGMLVTLTRETSDGHLTIVERWPDGAEHTYRGPLIRADDVEVWPASRP
jgi:hypothetical protein